MKRLRRKLQVKQTKLRMLPLENLYDTHSCSPNKDLRRHTHTLQVGICAHKSRQRQAHTSQGRHKHTYTHTYTFIPLPTHPCSLDTPTHTLQVGICAHKSRQRQAHTSQGRHKHTYTHTYTFIPLPTHPCSLDTHTVGRYLSSQESLSSRQRQALTSQRRRHRHAIWHSLRRTKLRDVTTFFSFYFMQQLFLTTTNH